MEPDEYIRYIRRMFPYRLSKSKFDFKPMKTTIDVIAGNRNLFEDNTKLTNKRSNKKNTT